MQAFHADVTLPLPAGHPFPVSKYRALRDAVAAEMPAIQVHAAEPASDGELALAHDPAWVSAVAEGTTTSAQQREIGFPWSPQMVERSRRSVGATIAAARVALFGISVSGGTSANRGADGADWYGEGVAANLAGGTHHAYAHKGSGYCVFNDVAVAARLMQAEMHRRARRLLRVWVIDLDVHQGNGTAAIFRDDPTVFTLSLHGQKNFPFRKEASDLDVELPDGTGDEAYLNALEGALARAWARQADAPPGLVFYLAGADPHADDRLGRLKLSLQGLAARDRRVFAMLGRLGLPVAISMAGGYNRNIDVTVAIHRETLSQGLELRRRWQQLGRPADRQSAG